MAFLFSIPYSGEGGVTRHDWTLTSILCERYEYSSLIILVNRSDKKYLIQFSGFEFKVERSKRSKSNFGRINFSHDGLLSAWHGGTHFSCSDEAGFFPWSEGARI